MNRVVGSNKTNRTITVQAGMPLHNLYKEVEALDLFFPPHPGDEGAFIGGTVATNAGGARAVKYGTVKNFVRGIQVVMPDGNITEFGGELVKSSTGYNLRDLFIGSEGTLGIITRITLMLLPKSDYTTTLVAPYNSIHKAIGTVPKIIASGIIPTAVEFIEHSVLRGIEKMLNLKWPAQTGIASLMFILDGKSEDIVMEDADKLATLLESSGADDILIAENKSKQADILKIRSSIYESLREAIVELFDICVPVSEIANHIDFVHHLEKKYDCCLPSFGHAADGNVHTHFLTKKLIDGEFKDPIPDWENILKKVKKELYGDAIKRGGVISGEHGIGKVKRSFLEETIGSVQIEIMRKIKKAIDPLNIMNPGKIL
jgi:glycolate oxidase